MHHFIGKRKIRVAATNIWPIRFDPFSPHGEHL